MTYPHQKIICYDGVCNLCNSWVSQLINLDKKKQFRYIWLQSETAHTLFKKQNFNTKTLSTVAYLKNNNLYTKSTAIILIIADLKGIWSLAKILLLIPTFIRDFIYKIIAKYRYNIFGKQTQCQRPSNEHLDLFIP